MSVSRPYSNHKTVDNFVVDPTQTTSRRDGFTTHTTTASYSNHELFVLKFGLPTGLSRIIHANWIGTYSNHKRFPTHTTRSRDS